MAREVEAARRATPDDAAMAPVAEPAATADENVTALSSVRHGK
jgi:hypothetical protein